MHRKLTILIDSSGNEALFNAVNSLPDSVNVITLVSGRLTEAFYNNYFMLSEREPDRIKCMYVKNKLREGLRKMTLLQAVETEYFMFLNEFDEINPDYLLRALQLLQLEDSAWVSFSYESRKSMFYDITQLDLLEPKEDLLEFLNEYLIVRTSKLSELFHLDSYSWIIPYAELTLNNSGLRFKGGLVNKFFDGRKRFISKEIILELVDKCQENPKTEVWEKLLLIFTKLPKEWNQ